MIDITTDYLGLQLKNPIIIGSSSMTSSFDEIVSLEQNGAAAVVLKSIFEEEILNEANIVLTSSNRNELIYSQLSNTLEYIKEHSVERKFEQHISFIKELKKIVQIPVIGSINCISDYEWIDYLPQMQNAGIDALELNVFLNRSSIISQNYEKTIQNIVKKVLQKVTVPVSVKLGNCFANQGQAISKLSKSGIAGLVLFNRFFSLDIDIYNMNSISGKILSSADDYYQSLRWIALMSGKVECSLAGATGIHHANALIKQILAGADAVQIVSTLYLNGKGYLKQILSDLETWMDDKGIFSLKQVKGKSSYKDIADPLVYERKLFMKHFGRIE